MKSILLILFITTSLSAQTIKNLVFEGGGMRGVSYAGALAILEEKGLMKNIEKVGGTSVGAITALTISLGYSATEIEKLISSTNPKKFNDGTFLFFGGGTRLRKHYGWYNGKKVLKWIEEIIETKTSNSEITFHQLHNQGYKDLYVTGTSLNNQKVILFSYESFPNMKVKDAIRISMSIPFIFEAVLIDSTGKTLKEKEAIDKNYDLMVDGGFISNYPIDIFDKIDSSGNRTINNQTLGFRIDTQAQVNQDKNNKALAAIEIENLRNYIGAFFSFIMENLNRSNLSDDDWKRTISISAELVGAKVRQLSSEQRKLLIKNGRDATEEYLTKHSNQP